MKTQPSERDVARWMHDRYRTELDWRDHLAIAAHVAWPLLLALILGGFGFIIMVASQQ